MSSMSSALHSVTGRVASWRSIVALTALLVIGCGDLELAPPIRPDQPDLFWELNLDHHAVLIAKGAPYDTLRLTATPRNFRGDALVGLPTPKYRSTDTDRVAITADGVLIAVGRTTAPVAVIATLTAQNLTFADTAMIGVVDVEAPKMLASLSIHPIPPDSTKAGLVTVGFLGLNDTLPVRARDDAGDAIPIYPNDDAGVLSLYFRSADTTIATVDRNTGVVVGMQVGTTKMIATTNAFGFTTADTVVYRVGWPLFHVVHLYDNAARTMFNVRLSDITIGVGGTIVWQIVTELRPLDFAELIFADDQLGNVRAVAPYLDLVNTISPIISILSSCSVDCTVGGSITFDGAYQRVGYLDGLSFGRHFPMPGVYEYHGTHKAAGIHGRITVVDES